MNHKKYYTLLLKFLFLLWFPLSFVILYYLTIGGWCWFSRELLYYLIFFQPVSSFGIAYILTNGELSKIKNKIKPIVAITVFFIVFAFTLLQWTNMTTNFGQYGTYVDGVYDSDILFWLNYGGETSFEKETIYREAMRYHYDLMFKKIWTFAFIMFAGTFLSLYAIGNKKKID